jgi:predicted MFS family arabinose efflux permease
MLSVAIVGSNSLALSPILADVARDLGSNAVEVARANAAYGGATALSALLLGQPIDRHGPRPVLAGALGALALAMLASAAAVHWAWLAAAQAAAGVAAGLVLPATYALATSTAPKGQGAQVLGRVLTGWSLALVAGVPLSAHSSALGCSALSTRASASAWWRGWQEPAQAARL